LNELLDIIEAKNNEEIRNRKRKVSDIFLLAELITEYIGRSMSGGKAPGEPTMPWDRFPKLFSDEKCAYEKEKAQIEQDNYIAQRKAYAAEFNRQRRNRVQNLTTNGGIADAGS